MDSLAQYSLKESQEIKYIFVPGKIILVVTPVCCIAHRIGTTYRH